MNRLGNPQGRPSLLDEIEKLVDLIKDKRVVLEVKDGAEEGGVDVEVEGVAIGPMGGLGGGAIVGPPREGDDAVAEGAHGLGVTGGVDGFGFGGSDDVTETESKCVGLVKRDGRVEEEAGFEDFKLAFLPNVVFAGVVEFRWF
ncbi:unnamed protein product [Camellia sinensis]